MLCEHCRRLRNIFCTTSIFKKMTMNESMLTLTSELENIHVLENYLNDLKSDHIICEERYPDILISLTEAVNNAIVHGNKTNKEKVVNIITTNHDKGIEFTITDEGEGFNPNEIPDPCSPDLVDKCGGRGVHIMSHLCDELSFMNNGSAVSLFFKLSEM